MDSKNENGFSHILVILLIVVVIGGIGYAGWRVYNDHEATATQKSIQSSTPAAIIQAIKTSLAKQYNVDSSENSPASPNALSITTDNDGLSGPPVKLTGYNFFVLPSSSNNLTTAYYQPIGQENPKTANNIYGIAIKEFASIGLTKAPSQSTIYNQTEIYQDSSVVCQTNTANVNPMSISCADLDNYSVKNAETIKPLAAAFFTKNENEVNRVVFYGSKVSPSKTTGYEIASLQMRYDSDGQSLEFYRRVDGGWNFLDFTGQSPISCETIAQNSDASIAFKGSGLDCMNDQGQALDAP